MARRCDRPGCSEPVAVAYGFDAVRRLVWLDALIDDDRARAGALCDRHAARLTAPRGWWLDDRRIDVPELFHEGGPAVAADAEAAGVAAEVHDGEPAPLPAKRRRRRKATSGPVGGDVAEQGLSAVALDDPPLPANLVPLSFDAAEPAVVAEGVVVVEEVMVLEDDGDVVGGEVVLEGAIVVEDDASPLDPILEPSTPLLARAFTGTARTDRPHHRPRRTGSAGGEAGEPPH